MFTIIGEEPVDKVRAVKRLRLFVHETWGILPDLSVLRDFIDMVMVEQTCRLSPFRPNLRGRALRNCK